MPNKITYKKNKNCCHSKKRYKIQRKADSVAKQMTEKNNYPYNGYWCRLCGNWHVGRDHYEYIGGLYASVKRG